MPDDESQPESHRFPLPRRFDVIGAFIFYPVIWGSVYLSVQNLTHYNNVPMLSGIASGALILFVAVYIGFTIQEEGGVRQYLVNRLGALSLSQLVRVFSEEDGSQSVRFGFLLLGREWSYLDIPADRILSVNWRTGQASALLGRDMNDWHVTLWYRDPEASQGFEETGFRTDEPYIVGSEGGTKQKTEQFGLQFVSFLQDAGIELVPSEKENEFVAV